jgi:hypothetical protein
LRFVIVFLRPARLYRPQLGLVFSQGSEPRPRLLGHAWEIS